MRQPIYESNPTISAIPLHLSDFCISRFVMLFASFALLFVADVQAAPAPTHNNHPQARADTGYVSCPNNSREIINTVLMSKGLDISAQSLRVAACCPKDSDGLGDWLSKDKGAILCSKLKGPKEQAVSSTFTYPSKPNSCAKGAKPCSKDPNGCCIPNVKKRQALTLTCLKGTKGRTNSVLVNGSLQKVSTCCASGALNDYLSSTGAFTCSPGGDYSTAGKPISATKPIQCASGSALCAFNSVGCCTGAPTPLVNDALLKVRTDEETNNTTTVNVVNLSKRAYLVSDNIITDCGKYWTERSNWVHTDSGHITRMSACCRNNDSNSIGLSGKLSLAGSLQCTLWTGAAIAGESTPDNGEFESVWQPKGCKAGAHKCGREDMGCCKDGSQSLLGR